MFGEKEARSLCQQVLSQCESDAAEALLFVTDAALTRFANNAIHQNVTERNVNLILRYFIGKRIGMATTNKIDASGIGELVTRARANAKASPEDPDYPGLPQPATYAQVAAFDQPTAEYSPKARAEAVSSICKLATEKALNASGAFSTGSGEIAIANTQGVFAYHASTQADFQTVVMGEDSSGRAHRSALRVEDLPVEALGRQAIEKAERGRNPQQIDPGEYTVVFDPYVTEDLVSGLNFYGMGAQAVLEGRSWMNSRMGEQSMSPMISIFDDGLDPDGVPLPFDFEGVPKQRVDIVREGLVLEPVYDRYTGGKAGKASTGHAIPPNFRNMGPLALNLFMAPGSASLDEMIRSTGRGLYITRFWYTRLVHPSDCVVTGMTRDGVFMIENGELTFPVKNLRFTQSYVQALADVEIVGKDTHLLMADFGNLTVRVPPLKISKFNFTGTTV